MHKRLKIDITPPVPGIHNVTTPTTPSPISPTGGIVSLQEPAIPPKVAPEQQRQRGGIQDPKLTQEEKVQRILQRHGESYCEELGIPIQQCTPAALWQWFCASVLFSARIKSNAGVSACQALFNAGLSTPQAMQAVTTDHCRQILRESGYERYDEKTAGFLVANAKIVMEQHQGDLNNIRRLASQSPNQERALLKKLKGMGDGGVDIFFREIQLVWDEIFPFADKKALKAARLVGLHEHPQSLAALCGHDKLKYVRLIAALVRIELSKTFNEY